MSTLVTTTMHELAIMNKLVMDARHRKDWIETTGDVYITSHAARVYSLPATYSERNKDVTIYNLVVDSALTETGISVGLLGLVDIDGICLSVKYCWHLDSWVARADLDRSFIKNNASRLVSQGA